MSSSTRPVRKRHSTTFFRDEQKEKALVRRSLPILPPNEETTPTEIPEVLIAPDGRKFYPCKYCCKAFAFKKAQISHIRFCSFGPDNKKNEQKTMPVLELNESNVLLTPIKFEAESSCPRQKPNIKKKTTNVDLKRVKREPITIPQMPVLKRITSTPKSSKKLPTPITEHMKTLEAVSLIPIKKTKSIVRKRPQNININKPTCCKECKEIFPNAFECLKHKQKVHLEDSMKVSPDSLTVYNKIFLSSNRSTCPICMKPTKASSWNRHLVTHSAKKNYKCDYCKRDFHRKDHLKNHLRTHFNGTIEEL